MVYCNIRETIGLCFGHFTIANLMNFLQQHLSAFLNGCRSIHDTAEIHIHVILHMLIGPLVCSDF